MEPKHKTAVDNMFQGMTLFPQETPPLELGKSLESFGRKTRERLQKAGWPNLSKKKASKRSFTMSRSTNKPSKSKSKSRVSSRRGSKKSLRKSRQVQNYKSFEDRSSIQEYNSYLQSVKNSRSMVDLAASEGRWRTPYKVKHRFAGSAKRRRPMSAQIRNLDGRRKVNSNQF